MCQYLDQYKEKQHYHAQEYIGFRQASANTAECVKKQQYLMRTSAKHVIHDTAKKIIYNLLQKSTFRNR